MEDDENVTMALGGIVINNTFAFGGNTSERIRVWGGPQVLIGFYDGETDKDYFGDEISFSGAGVGLGGAGGINFGLGSGKTVLSTTVGLRVFGFAGESKYPLRTMLAFAIEGVTSFSNVPLRVITMLGFAVSFFAFMMVFWVFGSKMLTSDAVPGWASTVIPMFFLGGVQLLSLGVVGEYIAKIYMETKRRPAYFIEKTV